MTNEPIGTVIFDLDGTLVDSAPDLADSLDILMAELKLEPFGLVGTRTLIGHGIPSLVCKALALRGHTMRPSELDVHTGRFIGIYSGRLSRKTKPYPGTIEALAMLLADGWRLAVCTNKREDAARSILGDLGLLYAFAQVAGPDTFGVSKPDPSHLTLTLPASALGAHPAVVVGDSMIDIAAARAAGLPVVAVAWGYAGVPVVTLGADAIAESFDQVPALVAALAK